MSDDDLDPLDEENEDDDDAGTDGPFDEARAKALIKKLRSQLKRRDKSHEKALEQAKEEAVTEYQQRQEKVAQAEGVFGGLGYKGLAGDFMALHPDAKEVKPEAAKEWLEARGLQVAEPEQSDQTPAPQPASPNPAGAFQQTGASTPQDKRYTGKEALEAMGKGELNEEQFKKLVDTGRLHR